LSACSACAVTSQILLEWGLSFPMTHYANRITVEKEGKQYYAYSEDLPGVYGVGPSTEDAKASILDAIRIYVLQSKKTGGPLPR
jgi:predicted RNase H-like HicB family nuclease